MSSLSPYLVAKNSFKFGIDIDNACRLLSVDISGLGVHFKLQFAFEIKVTTLDLSSVTGIILVKAGCETVIFPDPIHSS